jgi:hypothetical protein
MVIYLQHPVHGKKVATLELEAVYDEANGWERYDPDAPAPAPASEPTNAFIPTLVGRRRK